MPSTRSSKANVAWNVRRSNRTPSASGVSKARLTASLATMVACSDIDGILRGKYMGRDKFFSALEKGFGFCDVVLVWDCQDQLYDNVKYTGWHTGYPDAPVRLLPETCRKLPFEDDGLFFLGEFAPPGDVVCPRGLLRRVLERGRAMGYEVYSGFEYEFFVFAETPQSTDTTTLAPAAASSRKTKNRST